MRAVTLRGVTATRLDRLTRSDHASLHVVTMAAVAAVLHRVSAQDTVLVGFPAPGGGAGSPEVAGLLVARMEIAPDLSFAGLLAYARSSVLDGLRNGDYPLGLLADDLGVPGKAAGRNAFVDVAVESAALHPARAGAADQVSTRFRVGRTASGVRLELHYDSACYTAAIAARQLAWCVRVLDQLAADPRMTIGEADLLGPDDRAVINAVNATEAPIPPGATIHSLFERRTAESPDTLAIVADDSVMTCGELDSAANCLARTLIARGAGAGRFVAVRMARSPRLLVAILAVLKSGAAYLPIDLRYPDERARHMLAHSRAVLVIGDPPVGTGIERIDLAGETEWASDPTPPVVPVTARDPAYVIYTSGSTGTPKGVVVEHRAVVNRLLWMQRAYPIDAGDVLVQKTSISFDVSVWELFWWMLAGASLSIPPPGAERDPEHLVETIERHRATVVHFVPSMLAVFLDYVRATCAAPRLASLRRVFASGEELGAHHVRAFHQVLGAGGATLVNLYGPTEATVDVSHYLCTPDDVQGPVPIGRPIDNIRLYVLDRWLRIQPVGAPGQLCIGGAGLARGYLGRDDLTRERFVEQPFPREPRVYLTGDLARLQANGDLEYLGRMDEQVKIRGFRIEPGEIEQRLRELPTVGDAVVTAKVGTDGQRHLIGYVTASGRVHENLLIEHCRRGLPDYMVPERIVHLDAFPLSSSGKLDRRRLPNPSPPEGNVRDPRNELERSLAGIWAEVLGIGQVGVEDNFFALGGNSIHFVSILAKARSVGIDFTFQEFFQQPTVARLAALSAQRAATVQEDPRHAAFELVSAADRARLPRGIEDAYPLSMLQAGLIFQSEITHGTAQYHDIISFLIQAPLDVEAFRAAVHAVVVAHPVFRTSYHLTGFDEHLQFVHKEVKLPLEITDLRERTPQEQVEWHSVWLEQEKARPFAWGAAGLIRIHVQIISDTLYRYSLSQHNSALDGWSITLVHSAIFGAYHKLILGQPVNMPMLDNHMRNYIGLERAALASESDRAYWTRLLHSARGQMIAASAADLTTEAAVVRYHDVNLPLGLSAQLDALADKLGVPVKSVLLAAHVKVMAVLGGTDDVITGYEHSGRPEAEDAIHAIGLFLNTVPFRVQLRIRTWAELIDAVYQAETSLLPHRRYPMARMKQDLATRKPLFDTVFNFTHFYLLKELRRLPEFNLLDVRVETETEFVLRAEFSRHFFEEDLRLSLHYHAQVIDEARIAAIGQCYVEMLGAMTADPGAAHEDVRSALGSSGIIDPERARREPSTPRPGTYGRPTYPTAEAGRLARANSMSRHIAGIWGKVLGIPPDRIRMGDNFFDLGGNSLAALRVVAELDGLVSLIDFMRNSYLDKLIAVAQSGQHDGHGLRHTLHQAIRASRTLVCIPYAGGNAINYQSLAHAIAARRPDITVQALELPGHDPEQYDSALSDVATLAATTAEEITSTISTPVLLWGHCVGAAIAVEIARHLEAAGHELGHVFVGGKLLHGDEETRKIIEEVTAMPEEELLATLASQANLPALRELPARHRKLLAAAFRHDSVSANSYFLGIRQRWDGLRLGSPVTVVVADNDPMTQGYRRCYKRWEVLASNVGLCEIQGGGHYFCHARPDQIADIIIHRME